MNARDEIRRYYASVRLDRSPRGRMMCGRAIAFRIGSIAPWLDQSGSAARADWLAQAAELRRAGAISRAKVRIALCRESMPPALIP